MVAQHGVQTKPPLDAPPQALDTETGIRNFIFGVQENETISYVAQLERIQEAREANKHNPQMIALINTLTDEVCYAHSVNVPIMIF